MNYREELLAELKERLGENYTVRIMDVRKTNGVEKVGVAINELDEDGEEQCFGKTIYINSLLNELSDGAITVCKAVDEIMEQYRNGEEVNMDALPDIGSWSKDEVLGRIAMQVVNKERNEQMLADVPYKRFLDLAIVYRCKVSEVNGSFLLNNTITKRLGITQKELEDAADRNTKTDYIVKSMSEIYEEMGYAFGHHEDAGVPAMYVATNEEEAYGAAAILRPDILKSLSKKLNDNLMILPSSIHEILLVPEKQNGDTEMLRSMVAEVNRTQLEPEEVLSDQVYRYDRERETVSVA